MKVDGGTVSDASIICNKFCTFFSTVANKLKKIAFPYTNTTWRPIKRQVNSTQHQFAFEEVTEKTVLKHLKNLKRNSATGHDDIPPSFLKDTAYVIVKPLTHVINCSLKNGIIPS